jgi:gliding motility-associated-like protein
MKFLKCAILIAVSYCFSVSTNAQYIQVNDTYTAQQLVEDVLINSPCANATNFSVSGGNFGSQQSYGYFTNGSSAFPFADGIVLSTGKAVSAVGPNNGILSEGSTSWLGDSDLAQAIDVNNTVNATIIEFDFLPLTNKISFDYIFSSEQYLSNPSSNQCRFTDGFAFLLKEAAGTNPYQNLAIIPDTSIPVSVNTVRGSGTICPAANESYFGGFNSSDHPTNFNGQTTIMKAQATVVPGTLYHIKLVIADQGNNLYDSAIFLGGGSFNVGTNLGPDRLISTNNPICQGNTFDIITTEPGINSYKWFKDNIEIAGETNSILTVSTPGTYSVEITLGTSTCIAKGEIVIEYSPAPVLTNTTMVQCDEDQNGITLFNLTTLDSIITNNDTGFGPVTYYENLADAQIQNTSNSISNANSYSSSPKTIYASVSNSFGCFATATISLQISNNAFPFAVDYESCDLDDDIDGFYAFQLSDIDASVLSGLPSGLIVNYYPTYNDALLQTNILPSTYVNETQYISRIYAKIINGSDCYGIQAVDLYVNSNSPPNFEDEEIYICDEVPSTVSIATTFFSYDWSNGDNDFSTDLASPGEYTVTVTNSDGCEATKKFIAIASGDPTITSVDINDFQGDANTVTVNVEGLGTWEYSLDGINFQSGPTFNSLAPGEYQVYVRDLFKCGDDIYTFFILDYPLFFTPNDDTYNDVWKIENLDFYPNAVIRIYDRFGKLLKQIAPQNGWDGTLTGTKLPADDYWFVLELNNERTIKGHFSLKR